MGEVGGRPIHLQALIQAVHQTVEELKCIVLLPKLHTLTPQPITSTYITCNMQLLMFLHYRQITAIAIEGGKTHESTDSYMFHGLYILLINCNMYHINRW